MVCEYKIGWVGESNSIQKYVYRSDPIDSSLVSQLVTNKLTSVLLPLLNTMCNVLRKTLTPNPILIIPLQSQTYFPKVWHDLFLLLSFFKISKIEWSSGCIREDVSEITTYIYAHFWSLVSYKYVFNIIYMLLPLFLNITLLLYFKFLLILSKFLIFLNLFPNKP